MCGDHPPGQRRHRHGLTLADRFTDRGRPVAGRGVIAAVVSAAVLLDLMLRHPVSSVSGVAAVLALASVVSAVPHRRTPSAFGFLALAVVVSSNLMLRTSMWVVVPTVLCTYALLVVAAEDRLTRPGRNWILHSVVGWIVGHLEAVAFLWRPAAAWFARSDEHTIARIRGLIGGAVIAVILVGVLANADAVVSALVSEATSFGIGERLVVIVACVVPAGALGVMAHLRPADDTDGASSPASGPATEAVMGLTSMAVVLAEWAVLQLVVRLGGADALLEREGLTPAGYARRGFFELVLVAIVVATLLAVLTRWSRADRPHTTTRLTLVITAETLLLVAVTYSKLALYTAAFGLTMLRLSVAFFLAWLAMAVVLQALALTSARRRPSLLPALIASAALTLAVFGWIDPEGPVVDTNIALAEQGRDLDRRYLTTLGEDATSAIVELLPESAAAEAACRQIDEADRSWFDWNLSRWRAAKACEG